MYKGRQAKKTKDLSAEFKRLAEKKMVFLVLRLKSGVFVGRSDFWVFVRQLNNGINVYRNAKIPFLTLIWGGWGWSVGYLLVSGS